MENFIALCVKYQYIFEIIIFLTIGNMIGLPLWLTLIFILVFVRFPLKNKLVYKVINKFTKK